MVPPDEPLQAVIRRMAERHIGAMLVGTDGIVAGIFTERDLLRITPGCPARLAGIARGGLDDARPTHDWARCRLGGSGRPARTFARAPPAGRRERPGGRHALRPPADRLSDRAPGSTGRRADSRPATADRRDGRARTADAAELKGSRPADESIAPARCSARLGRSWPGPSISARSIRSAAITTTLPNPTAGTWAC